MLFSLLVLNIAISDRWETIFPDNVFLIGLLSSIPNQLLMGVLSTIVLTEFLHRRVRAKRERDELAYGLLHPEIITKIIADEHIPELANQALYRVVNNHDLSKAIYEIVENRVAPYLPYRDNTIFTCTLEEEDGSSSLANFFFYTLYREVSYSAKITTSKKKFVCSTGQEKNPPRQHDPEVEHRTHVYSRFEFDDILAEAFEVINFTIDNDILRPQRERRAKASSTNREVCFNIPQKYRDGETHNVKYTTKEKVLKRGHGLSVEIRVPTKGFQCKIDYSRTDISHMHSYDLLTSLDDADRPTSHVPRPGILEIDRSNQWVIPKSGMIFTWHRADERNNEFDDAIQLFPKHKDVLLEHRGTPPVT